MGAAKVRLLVFPTWVMHRRPFYPMAFSSVRFTVLGVTGLLGFSELFLGIMYFISNGCLPFWLLTAIALSTIGSIFVFYLALYVSKTLVISKDCFECQFSFHVIAHETNHIKMNSHSEKKVEEETLKQTRDKLIPLLSATPKFCNYCAFNGKFYKAEIEKYLNLQTSAKFFKEIEFIY